MKKLILALAASAVSVLAAIAATPASYPGGEEAMEAFISKNLVYPAPAKANGIEGVVKVSFQVGADGKIGSIKIVRMIDPDLEQEAIRIVKKMPDWNPATDDSGTPVSSKAEADIPFTLDE